jgi:hypothetical protein
MTQEEILEFNKKCAEFLGAKIIASNDSILPIAHFGKSMDEGRRYTSYELHFLRFHSDWNWIIEVVEAIENLDQGIYQVDILQEGCKIRKRCRDFIDYTVSKLPPNTTKKEAVVKAIDNFLILYND